MNLFSKYRAATLSISILAVAAAASGLTLSLYEPKPVAVQGAATVKQKPVATPTPAPAPVVLAEQTTDTHSGNSQPVATTASTQANPAPKPTTPTPTTPTPAPTPSTPVVTPPAPTPTPTPTPDNEDDEEPTPQPSFAITVHEDAGVIGIVTDDSTGVEIPLLMYAVPVTVVRDEGHTAPLQLGARVVSQPNEDAIVECEAMEYEKGILALLVTPLELLQPGDYVCEVSVSDGTSIRTARYTLTVPELPDEELPIDGEL